MNPSLNRKIVSLNKISNFFEGNELFSEIFKLHDEYNKAIKNSRYQKKLYNKILILYKEIISLPAVKKVMARKTIKSNKSNVTLEKLEKDIESITKTIELRTKFLNSGTGNKDDILGEIQELQKQKKSLVMKRNRLFLKKNKIENVPDQDLIVHELEDPRVIPTNLYLNKKCVKCGERGFILSINDARTFYCVHCGHELNELDYTCKYYKTNKCDLKHCLNNECPVRQFLILEKNVLQSNLRLFKKINDPERRKFKHPKMDGFQEFEIENESINKIIRFLVKAFKNHRNQSIFHGDFRTGSLMDWRDLYRIRKKWLSLKLHLGKFKPKREKKLNYEKDPTLTFHVDAF